MARDSASFVATEVSDGAAISPVSAAAAHFERGSALDQQGDLKAAERSYRQAGRLPKSSDEQTYRAAQFSFVFAVAADPAFAAARKSLGRVLERHGDLEGAEAEYREAVRLSPALAANHFSLGLVLEQKGAKAEAASSYRRSIELDPLVAGAHFSLGIVLEEQGNVVAAIDSYRETVQLNSTLSAAWFSLASALEKTGDLEGSRKSYLQTIQLNPSNARAHFNLGSLQERQGELQNAKTSYENGIALAPTVASARFSLGLVLEQNGELEAAKDSFRQAVSLAPTQVRAHRYLSMFLKKLGDLVGAADSIRKVIGLEPRNSAAHFDLGRLLDKSGSFEEAEKSYIEAIKLDPLHAASHAYLGAIQKRHGNLAGAEQSVLEAIRLNPGNAEAHNNLGVVRKLAGNLAGAEASYRQAIDLDPSYAAAHGNLGIALMLKMKGSCPASLEEAERSFRQAVQLDPTYDGAWYSLGGVLSLRGDIEGAKETARSRVRLAEKQGTWPFRLSMTQMETNEMVSSRLASEAAFAERYVAAFEESATSTDSTAPATKDEISIRSLAAAVPKPPGLRELPAALRRVRDLENSTAWMLRRWDECFALGEDSIACAYGTTWFDGWLTVMADKSLRDALSSYVASDLEFTIGGSAIGYQCFFAALGLGLPCTGYELLPGLVKDSETLLLGLSAEAPATNISFVCGDATSADLSRTGVLWLNDALWPTEVRQQMLSKAAATMPAGSTIISYQPLPPGSSFGRLGDERVLTASVSWNAGQRFFLWTLGSSARADT
ncbi:unnamed protein product [Polarella glacialis]|uniref:Protein O-GlcNAc transferase n=1 Tax=Polarella glacialis TaxID=89957 RepID=A0A813HFC8_POLGL|nr:unnamed protein product [Polarella glacialis]CAE8711424.1 unnamed protein product [Polarella glacialis]